MYNWNKVFTDGEIKYLLVNPADVVLTKEVQEAMDRLMNSYIDSFGLSKKVKKINRLKQQLIKKQLEYIERGVSIVQNDVKVLRRELEAMQEMVFIGSDKDFGKSHVLLQKWYGQVIDLKKISVYDYYLINESYVEQNKQR
jgi:hypothetical protein